MTILGSNDQSLFHDVISELALLLLFCLLCKVQTLMPWLTTSLIQLNKLTREKHKRTPSRRWKHDTWAYLQLLYTLFLLHNVRLKAKFLMRCPNCSAKVGIHLSSVWVRLYLSPLVKWVSEWVCSFKLWQLHESRTELIPLPVDVNNAHALLSFDQLKRSRVYIKADASSDLHTYLSNCASILHFGVCFNVRSPSGL